MDSYTALPSEAGAPSSIDHCRTCHNSHSLGPPQTAGRGLRAYYYRTGLLAGSPRADGPYKMEFMLSQMLTAHNRSYSTISTNADNIQTSAFFGPSHPKIKIKIVCGVPSPGSALRVCSCTANEEPPTSSLQPKLMSDTRHGHLSPRLWLIGHGYYIRSCATGLRSKKHRHRFVTDLGYYISRAFFSAQALARQPHRSAGLSK